MNCINTKWIAALCLGVFLPSSLAQSEARSECSERQKAGQLLMLSVPHLSGDLPGFKVALKRDGIGGVLLGAWNLKNLRKPTDVAAYIRQLQDGLVIPLFVAIDQEGGSVQRLQKKQGFAAFPSHASLGEINDDYLAWAMGRAIGRDLRSVGINWNFAPVLDVRNRSLAGVSLGRERFFSSDPWRVARLGISMAEGMSVAGVIATVKHFPGHGRTFADSHEYPAVLGVNESEFYQKDLVPFAEAAGARVPAIMAGHIEVPQVCPDAPASLSSCLIDGVLRKKLGYSGLVVSDDLAMKSISDRWSSHEAALQAVLAGVDVLVVRHGSEDAILDHFCKQLNDRSPLADRLRERINLSYARVMDAKRKHGIFSSYP